jgi:hypothetical protein
VLLRCLFVSEFRNDKKLTPALVSFLVSLQISAETAVRPLHCVTMNIPIDTSIEGFAMGEARCWECGREVPEGAIVCPHKDCGVLNPVIKSGDDGTLVNCRNPECSRQVKKNATVCSGCGMTTPGIPDNWGWQIWAAIAFVIAVLIVLFF